MGRTFARWPVVRSQLSERPLLSHTRNSQRTTHNALAALGAAKRPKSPCFVAARYAATAYAATV